MVSPSLPKHDALRQDISMIYIVSFCELEPVLCESCGTLDLQSAIGIWLTQLARWRNLCCERLIYG